ncbi:universal stress protein [Sphingomonas sp. ST-64]|uniref:Universal stress protein n=1 Tax=Sphingomonas plantiphila TaxID=3163295 RepID=A0ABW8YI73_9SPHN
MKNVAVLIHPDEGQEARVQAALDVTRALNGHLIAVEVTALVPVAEDPMLGAFSAGLVAEELARQEENLADMLERLGGEDVAWSADRCAGDVGYCLSQHTALADLIVLNTQFDSFPGREMGHLTAALVALHRPVLAVPSDSRGVADRHAAMVAWDGSDAAEAALRAAIPLLALHPETHVVSVARGSINRPPELAASYLSRHGIKPEITVITNDADTVASNLIVQARGVDASLIVMGGYGHSRLRESLFGGVTRTLLEESHCPLFLSH